MSIIGAMIWVPKFGVKTYQVVLYGAYSGTITVDDTDTIQLSSGTATIYLPEGIHKFVDGNMSTNVKNLDIQHDCSVVVRYVYGSISQVASNVVHNYNGGSATAYGSKSRALPSDNIAPVSHGYISGQCRVRQNNPSYAIGPACSISGHLDYSGTRAATRNTTSNALKYSSGFSGDRYSSWYSMSGTANFTAVTTGTITAEMYATVTESNGSSSASAWAQVEVSNAYIY